MHQARMAAVVALAAAIALLLPACILSAQTIGPGGIPIAPGPSQPGYTPGGIGPGGIPIAPGPAARSIPSIVTGPGPGGIPIAPGPAGHLPRQRVAPVGPTPSGSGTIATTIMTEEPKATPGGPKATPGPARSRRAHGRHRASRHKHGSHRLALDRW
jgi:hypothetical protein